MISIEKTDIIITDEEMEKLRKKWFINHERCDYCGGRKGWLDPNDYASPIKCPECGGNDWHKEVHFVRG